MQHPHGGHRNHPNIELSSADHQANEGLIDASEAKSPPLSVTHGSQDTMSNTNDHCNDPPTPAAPQSSHNYHPYTTVKHHSRAGHQANEGLIDAATSPALSAPPFPNEDTIANTSA